MPKKIFKEGKKYTFSDYFEMKNPTEEIIAELGYYFATKNLVLPISENIDADTIL